MMPRTLIEILALFIAGAGTTGVLTAIVAGTAGFISGALFAMAIGAFFGPWLGIVAHRMLERDREEQEFLAWHAARLREVGLDDDQRYD